MIVIGQHGVAMLSVDQLPASYTSSVTAVNGARWPAVGTYPCEARSRSRSPPYSAVSRGPVSGGGSGALPSPSRDGSAVTVASTFGVVRVPPSSVFLVDTASSPSYTPLHANLATADNSSYFQPFSSLMVGTKNHENHENKMAIANAK